MTEHDAGGAHGKRKSRVARRRFLSGLGSGGLAAAAVVFGKPTAASAYTLNCCHLCFKPSISVATCQGASKHYVWGCTADGGFLHCTCCERGATTATCSGVNASAGSCQYN
jgi:hypothetical protein